LLYITAVYSIEGITTQTILSKYLVQYINTGDPMKSTIKRLARHFRITVFPEPVILEEPIENWPIVECLIAFYSNGFPLEKAIEYAKMKF
jgi:hypothetical protein